MKKSLIATVSVAVIFYLWIPAFAEFKAPEVNFSDVGTLTGNGKYVVETNRILAEKVDGENIQSLQFTYQGKALPLPFTPGLDSVSVTIPEKGAGVLKMKICSSQNCYDFYKNVDTGDFHLYGPLSSTSGDNLYLFFWITPLYGFDIEEGNVVSIALKDKNRPTSYETFSWTSSVQKDMDWESRLFIALRMNDSDIREVASLENFRPVFEVTINGSTKLVEADKAELTRYKMCTFDSREHIDYRGEWKNVGLDCNVVTSIETAVKNLQGLRFVIWSYKNDGYTEGRWERYFSNDPGGATITEINSKQGYWIRKY